MIHRKLFLIILLVLGGFMPALAQEVFIPKETGAAPGEKPTLFVMPKFDLTAPTASVKYKDKIKNETLKQASALKLKTLADWRASGYEPQNIQEQMALADATRAVHQNLMYKRRDALILHLQKEHEKFQAEYNRQQAQVASAEPAPAQKPNLKKAMGQEEDNALPAATTTTIKKPTIYLEPSKNQAGPNKVFTDYR